MYKFLQVHKGKNSFEITVGKGKTVSIILTCVNVLQANVSLRVVLAGIGARAVITGLVIGTGNQELELHTMQIHKAPQTTSDLLVKSVLSDRARSLYDGGIRVEKDAQKTNAYQRNENLLLTGRAYAQSKPSLEILANDVRCTHGATAGPVDPQELWYLASRGIPSKAATRLIVDGFIDGALSRIEDAAVRSRVYNVIHHEARKRFVGRS